MSMLAGGREKGIVHALKKPTVEQGAADVCAHVGRAAGTGWWTGPRLGKEAWGAKTSTLSRQGFLEEGAALHLA